MASARAEVQSRGLDRVVVAARLHKINVDDGLHVVGRLACCEPRQRGTHGLRCRNRRLTGHDLLSDQEERERDRH